MSKLNPQLNRIFVKSDEVSDVRPSGMVLTGTKEKPATGVVIAVGPGQWENGFFVPMTIKEGDRILYGKYAGTEIVHEEEQIIVMKSTDVMAVLTEV